MEGKKNIIIVSPFWTGIRGFFLKGDDQFKGMPAFTTTFMHLLNDNRIDTIYTVFFGSKMDTKYNYKDQYQKKLKVFGYTYANRFMAAIAFLRTLNRIFWLVFTKNIHVIYGHGSVGGVGGLMGNLLGVPNIRRIYGTFLSTELADTKWKIFLRHPLEYMSFSLPAKGVVITNDGTKGDLVFAKIGHKNTPLHFWLNGIDKTNDKIKPYNEVASSHAINFDPQICYIARIDKWKRQHLLVDILIAAKKQNKVFNTIIAGPVINTSYFKSLQKKIEDNDLGYSVSLIPGLTKAESLSVISNSTLSISFYNISNLGNVFLESLSLGTLMVSENINGSLAQIDSDVYIDVDPKDSQKTVEIIENLLNNDEIIASKSKAALEFSNQKLLTWKERTSNEIALLEL